MLLRPKFLRRTYVYVYLSTSIYLKHYRTHVARKHVSRPGSDEQLVSGYVMSTDTCRRIQVACSGYTLTVSRRHNYTIHLCHGRLVSLYIQQQTGDILATILFLIQDTCWQQQVDTTCIRQYVSWCKRGFTYLLTNFCCAMIHRAAVYDNSVRPSKRLCGLSVYHTLTLCQTALIKCAHLVTYHVIFFIRYQISRWHFDVRLSRVEVVRPS